tara:strand:- start:15578 stop:15862 length:285 start_codon:yes stop_codon:yes gene_type:complete
MKKTKTLNIYMIVKEISNLIENIDHYNKKFDTIDNIINSKKFKLLTKKQKHYFFFVLKNDFPITYKYFKLYFSVLNNINSDFIYEKIEKSEDLK